MFEKYDSQTEFNAAVASLERMHGLLNECNEYSRLCRVSGYNVKLLTMWRDTISALYREVSPKLKEPEKNRISTLYDLGKELGNIRVRVDTREGYYFKIDPDVFSKYWQIFHKVELLLRYYADKKGMLIPNKMGFGDSISQME